MKTQQVATAFEREANPELLNVLIATWIIIEDSPDFLEYIGHCTSKDTGKTLHETARAAIAKATKK